MNDSDPSDLSSYASESSSDAFEINLNASNDARSNTPRDSVIQKLPTRQKSNDESVVPFATIKVESQMIVEGDALTVKISPDKLAYAVGLSNGVIKIFFVDKQMNENTVIALKSPKEKLPCNDMCFIDTASKPFSKKSPNLLAVYSSGYIRLWDCFNQVAQTTMIFEVFESADPCDFNLISEEGTIANELLCVASSMDATRFVTGGSDTIIKVYDLTTRLRLLNLKSGSRTYLTKECTHHTSRITALVYHPRGKNDPMYSHIFVSASWDQTIQIWDDRKVASLWHYYGPQVVGSDGLDIDGMQNIIVAASWVRSGVMLKMWKFADFSITGSSLAAKRKILQNYSKPVYEVALEGSEVTTQGYVARIGGEGRYIFYAGYGMNILKVIDRESMSIVTGLTDLPNAVYSLDSCLDPRDRRRCLLIFTNTKNVYLASVQSRSTFLEVATA